MRNVFLVISDRHSDWNNPRQANVQRIILQALFPRAEVRLLRPGDEVSAVNLLTVSRAHKLSTVHNKYLEPYQALATKWFPAFRETVLKIASGAFRFEVYPPKTKGRLRIIYVWRASPRRLLPDLEEQLLAALRANHEVIVVDFAQLSLLAQITLSEQTDVFVGVHGNGLTNVLWLRPGATLVEIFPTGRHHYDYQFFAEIAGLNYYGVEGANIFRPFDRRGPIYGTKGAINVPVDYLPLDVINAALVAAGEAH